MPYNLLLRTSNNSSSPTPGYGTAHTGDESGTGHDSCVNNLCTNTSRFYVGYTISYNISNLSNAITQTNMQANLVMNITHTCKVKQSVIRQETEMLQHSTTLTNIGTLTGIGAEQHIIADQKVL